MASPIQSPGLYQPNPPGPLSQPGFGTQEAKRQIPVYAPDLNGHEREYVLECLDTTWISSKGSFISRFEADFAHYVQSPFAVSICNGTLALHLALLALGIGEGDEVIVPTLTYIASANAVTYTGAKPVFADSVANTWQIDPADVVRKITPRTRAIMAVHLYGHPADMDALTSICAQYKLDLIEDCAEAIGTMFKGRHVGTFGKVSAFSFFGNKTITTGEGGMVITNQADIHDRVCRLRGQGLAKDREYWHDIVGYNYRMTNICAAIGVAQLERIGDIARKKVALAQLYKSLLRNVPVAFQGDSSDIVHSYWMVCILTDEPEHRDSLRQYLAAEGIETRPLFPPIHQMPMYFREDEAHVIAENLSVRGINLPSWPGLGLTEVRYICDKIRGYFESCAKGRPDGTGAIRIGSLK